MAVILALKFPPPIFVVAIILFSDILGDRIPLTVVLVVMVFVFVVTTFKTVCVDVLTSPFTFGFGKCE